MSVSMFNLHSTCWPTEYFDSRCLNNSVTANANVDGFNSIGEKKFGNTINQSHKFSTMKSRLTVPSNCRIPTLQHKRPTQMYVIQCAAVNGIFSNPYGLMFVRTTKEKSLQNYRLRSRSPRHKNNFYSSLSPKKSKSPYSFQFLDISVFIHFLRCKFTMCGCFSAIHIYSIVLNRS